MADLSLDEALAAIKQHRDAAQAIVDAASALPPDAVVPIKASALAKLAKQVVSYAGAIHARATEAR